MKKRGVNSGIYLITIFLWTIYGIATFMTPAPPTNPYHLTQFTTYIIQASIVLPLLIIWLIAVNGAAHLYRYAQIVKTTPDGAGFYPISWGINLIVIHMILSSFINIITAYVRYTTSLIPLLTIVSQLLYVLVYLIAFSLLFNGTKKLVRSIKYDRHARLTVVLYGFCLLVLMAAYSYLLITNPNRSVSQNVSVQASYFLPDSLILVLIVIPTFITWILSLFAYINLELLQRKVTGILYKKALANLVRGLLAIIAGSILTQGLSSVGSSRFLQYGLTNILIIIYILLLIIVVGYIYVALGARKLTMVEEL